MNVTGKITFFVKEVGKEKKIKIFETTIARYDSEKEKYLDNFTIRIEFAKDFLDDKGKAKLLPDHAYGFEIEEAFLTTRSYEKDGEKIVTPILKILKGKSTGKPKAIKKTEKKSKKVEDDPVDPDGDDELPF